MISVFISHKLILFNKSIILGLQMISRLVSHVILLYRFDLLIFITSLPDLLQIFAVGFFSGCVRIFHCDSTSVISEHPSAHDGHQVISILFTSSGNRLITRCKQGIYNCFSTLTSSGCFFRNIMFV